MSDTDNTVESSPPRTGERKWLFWAVMLVALAAIVIYNNRPIPPSAVEWVDDFEAAKAKAAESNKLLLIDFYATWCYPCKQMEREVFSRTEASEALGNWVAVKVDVDRQAKPPQLFQVVSVPTLVALSPQGKEIARVNTGMDLQQFVDWIKKVENIAAGRAAEPTTNTKQAIAATPTAGTDKAEGWAEGFEAAKARAAEANRLLFVDFYATWCGPCQLLDNSVFPKPEVVDAMADWVKVKVDVDRQRQIASEFRVYAMPTLIALSPQGKEIDRVMGYLDAAQFVGWIAEVEKKWARQAAMGSSPGA
ncbi:MAG: thioredoxin fold domain-containing protein [Planctomycetes bacterium]|nr:thioredoxin fold domain-containing protein [Planctomycetota bacterium]